jgi:hypothetical protein
MARSDDLEDVEADTRQLLRQKMPDHQLFKVLRKQNGSHIKNPPAE